MRIDNIEERNFYEI